VEATASDSLSSQHMETGDEDLFFSFLLVSVTVDMLWQIDEVVADGTGVGIGQFDVEAWSGPR